MKLVERSLTMRTHSTCCLPHAYCIISVIFFILASLLCDVEGYSKGAPFSTCLTMFPKHGHTERQSGPPPYRIDLQPASYRPGQVITVIMVSADQRPFKGLQVKAVRSQGDGESAVGTFVHTPSNITKVFTCEGGYKNMVTHTGALKENNVHEVRLTWKAPDTNMGDLVFVATFVEDYDTFWTRVTSTLATEDRNTVSAPEYQLAEVMRDSTDRIELDSCGDTKGCFLYPRYCTGDDCKAAVTFRQDGADYFRFELMVKDATYVSVGFSDDLVMGDDETIICTAEDHRQVVSVQHGFNPKLYNQRIVRKQLSELTVNRTDGHLTCSFRRPRVAVTRFVNQSASELQYINKTYDLHQDYYLQLAWGAVKQGSDVINKHVELPPVTDTKVSFRTYAIYRGSALPVQARIHACLMAVAWVFVAGLTTAISRYYKHWLSSRVFCGTSIWFQIHRAAGITAGILTASSVVLIIIFIGGFAEKEQKHAIMGFTVLSLVGVQILAGMLRPDKTSRYRSYFKWGHLVLGQSAHILSAVAMYLAFDIRYVPAVMREFGITVLTGWVPLQIGWTIVLELRRCCTVQEGIKKEQEPWTQVMRSADTILLFFYCLTLLLLMAATLSAILVF